VKTHCEGTLWTAKQHYPTLVHNAESCPSICNRELNVQTVHLFVFPKNESFLELAQFWHEKTVAKVVTVQKRFLEDLKRETDLNPISPEK
jgi:hypothetical protein